MARQSPSTFIIAGTKSEQAANGWLLEDRVAAAWLMREMASLESCQPVELHDTYYSASSDTAWTRHHLSCQIYFGMVP